MNALYKLYCRCFQRVMYVAEYFLPWRVPEQISGEGSLAKLPAFAKAKGFKSALLVTDQGLMSLGMAQPIIDGFKAEGLNIAVYDKVVPNPTITNIEEGLKLYKDNNCDVIIALGGGSPMDCAKGIGARVARPRKSIPKMKGLLRVMRKLPPLVAIPTTSGTGSEATLAAVISNPDTHEKYPINDPVLIPHYAVMDPLLTVGLPKHITSTTGMDALTHAVEAYVSTGATPLTDACAEKAIKLVSENLRRAVANGSDIHAREGMCYAQYLAGMAFNNASLGHVHAMAHQLGGFYNLPHGECNAILLPIVEEYNLLAHLDKFINIARMMDENIDGLSKRDAAELAISAIRRLSQDVGIPASITELAKRYGKEVSRSDIPTMVANAQKDACGLTNPRKMTDAAVQQLYEIAF